MMVTETEVMRRAEAWIRSRDATILQAVYPGGQARLSLSYRAANGTRRTLFPDLLAVMSGKLILGEAKPLFSGSDASKLIDIADSEAAMVSIRSLLWGHFQLAVDDAPMFLLMHADTRAKAIPRLYQLVVPLEGAASHFLLPPAE